MRVFVAGASGAIGRRLVAQLIEGGHEVTGTTTRDSGLDSLGAMGARGVVMDALDEASVRRAIASAQPEVVVHQATGLSAMGSNPRRMPREFELTNRLRSEGTDNLLAAARQTGARRFIAQSFTGWPYAREGGPVKTEEDPLDPVGPPGLEEILAAIKHLERAVSQAQGIEGLVLRYGGFYGPGTGLAADGDQAEAVRERKFPLVGPGEGIWSFVHIDDAASATAAAVERGAPGVYNVVDDDPAPVREWLRTLAEALGAKPPRRIPTWLARLVAGPHTVVMMNEIRGASNAKAKRELGWTPSRPSWRQGFQELGAA